MQSKNFTISVLLILFFIFLLPPLSPARTPQEIAQTALGSTVLVTITNASGQSSFGSGFVVGTGQIATNLHVIEGIASGTVKLVGETTEHVIESVLIVDLTRDLAIVKATSLTAPSLTLGDSDTVQIGESVYAAGNPQGLTGTFSQGIISAIRPEGNSLVAGKVLQMTAPISPGSSGGPVLDESGEVIGIAVGATVSGQNLNYAIPVNNLKTLLTKTTESVTIPDANLRSVITTKRGKASGAVLTVGDMTTLTGLDARNANIGDLTGLEFAVNLTWISLGSKEVGDTWVNSNSVSDISPLAGLTNLNWIDLTSNSITDISSLSGLTNLTTLVLGGNSIADISVLAGLTNLTTLFLQSNSITDISALSGLTRLEKLRLAGNPIDDTSPLCGLLDQNSELELDIEVMCNPYSLFMQDYSGDGEIDIADLFFLLTVLFNAASDGDFNKDGNTDFLDLVAEAEALSKSTTSEAPAVALMHTVSLETVQAWIDMAYAADDGSLTFQRGIANLERLLNIMRPNTTALLPNYPNPFNPETWIPYRLAHAADVMLTIYDMKGVMVRQLGLGHQPAGYYTDKTHAAYWDGRNNLGEPVESGIYFYQLQVENSWSETGAGDFSTTRKLVILK